MFTKCANPDCGLEFDYGHGRYFCFRRSESKGAPPPRTHGVEHHWLCGQCAKSYALDYRDGEIVLVEAPIAPAADHERAVAIGGEQ